MRRRTLFARLLLTNLAISIGALLVLGIVLDRLMERRVTDELRTRLVADARATAAAAKPLDGTELQSLIRRLGAASGTRLTVIRADGVVLADSEHDPATMENHATRPEVVVASAGRVGSDQRVSDTLGRPFLYVAVPRDGNRIVRAALPADVVAQRRSDVRTAVGLALLGVVLVGVALAILAARSIARPLSEVAAAVTTMQSGANVNVKESGPEEVRRVARALNAMARELDARIDDLAREGALREQILSAMTEGVVLTEPSGGIVYSNPAAQRMLGGSATMLASLAGEGIHEITLHHPHRRELRAATVRMVDGRTLVALQDVTESKRVEAMRRDFVADASHELKTPVAAILASAETLQHAMLEDPESAKRFAARLESDARRLADLVTELLDLARFEKGPPERERVDVSALVAHEADAARPVATAKQLGFASDVAGGVWVNGDGDEIAQAVRNLVENAIRYTDSGAVAVGLSAIDGRAVIEVRDSGVGIPSKDLPRVFERFYRVDRARSRATGGTGLGLSIVKHVAERHGGDVRAQSRLGEGSVFTIELPLAGG